MKLSREYFSKAPAEDACWGLFIISGGKIPTKINRTFIQEAFTEFIGMPMWLFKESYYHVGDSSETMALLRGPTNNPVPAPALGDFIENELLTLRKLTDERKKDKTSFVVAGL